MSDILYGAPARTSGASKPFPPRQPGSSLRSYSLTCPRPGLTPLLGDRRVGLCATQITPEHAKQGLGRRYLAVLQEIENRGQRARLGLRVNGLARLVFA